MYPLIRRYLRRVDVVYLLLCAACSAISVVVLLSIGQTQLGSNNKASVQLIASLLGLMLTCDELEALNRSVRHDELVLSGRDVPPYIRFT